MKTQMVRHVVDWDNPPKLSEERKAALKALSERPDSEIDYSDIAPLDESFWKSAVRTPFYKPTKKSTTVRLDSDVLHWLKQQGRGYQSRINAILRREMLTALKQNESK